MDLIDRLRLVADELSKHRLRSGEDAYKEHGLAVREAMKELRRLRARVAQLERELAA